jgi:hypothetical protein
MVMRCLPLLSLLTFPFLILSFTGFAFAKKGDVADTVEKLESDLSGLEHTFIHLQSQVTDIDLDIASAQITADTTNTSACAAQTTTNQLVQLNGVGQLRQAFIQTIVANC